MSDSVRPHRRQPIRLHRPWDSPGKNTGVGCHFLLQCMKAKSESEVAQSCPTLRDPMDCSPPDSSVHGIFQAKVLEWGAIAFSKALKRKVKVKSLSRVGLLATPWTAAHQAPPSMGFSRQGVEPSTPPKFCKASGPLNPPIFIYMGIQTWKPSRARVLGDIAQGVLRWVFSL